MLPRRSFLAALGGAALASGCRRKALPASCQDTTGLAAPELEARKALAYADQAANPDHTCERCQQYLEPPDSGGCGGCKILRGPIHPNGTCRAFAAKAS
jgi:hypothetical protein